MQNLHRGMNESRSISAQRSQKGFVGLVSLAGLAIGGLNMLLLVLTLVNTNSIAKKPAPSMVQLSNGEVLPMTAQDVKARTPQTIMKFTSDSLSLLLSWSGRLPSPDPQAAQKGITNEDPGVTVKTDKGGRKVTTIAHQASFALSEDFRQSFLKKLAEMTPPEVFNGTAQVVLVPQDISFPEPVPGVEGQWKINIVSNLITISPGSEQVSIPFNKEVFVRAVPSPIQTQLSSPVEQSIAQVRAAGLEIYAMRELSRPNLVK